MNKNLLIGAAALAGVGILYLLMKSPKSKTIPSPVPPPSPSPSPDNYGYAGDSGYGDKQCPEGQKLMNVQCVTFPCPPECVPINWMNGI